MAVITITSGNVEFGPCQVTFNAQDLGSFIGGVTWRYSYGVVKSKPDQLSAPNNAWMTNEEFVVTVPMIETAISMLQYVMPLGTYSTNATKKKIVVGGDQLVAGDRKQLIITPTSDGSSTLDTDANNKVTVHKALCMGPIEKQYNLDKERALALEFHAFADTTQVAGNQLFTLGDTTT